MKKKLISIFIGIIFVSIVFGQTVDSFGIFLTKFQKVAYVTPDSTYKFTRFIAPNGKFYFQEGFADSGYYCGGVFYGYSDFVTPPGKYRLLCESLSPDIDTVKSCFPANVSDHYENSTLNKIGEPTISEYKLDYSYIIDELTYSYIIDKIAEPGITNLKDHSLRIMHPCHQFGLCAQYNIFKIVFYSDSIKFFSIMVQSVDYNGIQLIRNDSCLFKRKDIEKIMKHLNKIKSISDITCNQPGNAWILEYKNGNDFKRFIVTNYCLAWQKKLKPLLTFHNLILRKGNKYFDTNCSLSP